MDHTFSPANYTNACLYLYQMAPPKTEVADI